MITAELLQVILGLGKFRAPRWTCSELTSVALWVSWFDMISGWFDESPNVSYNDWLGTTMQKRPNLPAAG